MQVAGVSRHANTLVVDLDFFVGFEVVPHEHSFLASNQGGAHLHGGQPVHVNVRDDVLGEIDGDERNVFDTVQMLFARSYDGFRLLPDHVVHDGEIVRGEVPNDVDVVLEQAKIDAKGIVVVQIA